MNILDIIVIGAILLYVLNGFYRGFLPSLLNLGGFFISWLVSFVTYPLLSKALINSEFFSSLRFYIEGAEKVGNFEAANMAVSGLPQTQLTSIMENAKMASPFNNAIISNIKAEAFAGQGLKTVGEYFDMTIYCIIINIIAFWLIFVCIRVLFTLLTNAYSYSMNLPQLQRFDATAGGVVALFRGFFSMHIVFIIIPIALIMVPSQVTSILNSSFTTTLFYSGSTILPFISGHI